MWQCMLSKADVPSIYIDAYKNDYLEDVFKCIASAILSFIEDNIDGDSEEKSEEIKKESERTCCQSRLLVNQVGGSFIHVWACEWKRY